MVQREVRYALVDLGNQTWDVKGICADNFGTWGTYLQELRFWWEIDPTLVVLTTGVLTGTGAPGTGAMTWCYLGKTGTVCTGGRPSGCLSALCGCGCGSFPKQEREALLCDRG